MQQIFHTAGGNFSAPNFKLTPRDVAGPASGSGAGRGQSSASQNGDFSLIVFPKQRISQTLPQGSGRSRAPAARTGSGGGCQAGHSLPTMLRLETHLLFFSPLILICGCRCRGGLHPKQLFLFMLEHRRLTKWKTVFPKKKRRSTKVHIVYKCLPLRRFSLELRGSDLAYFFPVRTRSLL